MQALYRFLPLLLATLLLATLLLATVLLATVSCASAYKVGEVDASLLSGLPATAMVEIDAARAQFNFAEDTLAESEKAATVAAKQAQLARARLDVDRAELAQAKLDEQLAEQTDSPLAVASARRVRALKLFEMGVSRAQLAVAERFSELTNAESVVARETMPTRRAEVELFKAKAVSQLDLAEAQAVAVAEFQKDVFGHEQTQANAEGKLARANEELLDAKIRLNEAEQKLEAQRKQNASEEATDAGAQSSSN